MTHQWVEETNPDFPMYLGRDSRIGQHDGYFNHSLKTRKMNTFEYRHGDIYYFAINSFKLSSGSYKDRWMNLAGRKSNMRNKTNLAVHYLRSHYGWVINTSDDILGF